MKKTALFLVTMMAMVCTSCVNDDYFINRDISGFWEGEVRSEYFDWRWGETVYQYQSVEFEFVRDNSYGGHGWEIDYDRHGWKTDQIYFDYEVVDGIIFIDYEYGKDVAIDNYSISRDGRLFEGSFYEWRSGRYREYIGKWLADFRLQKIGGWRSSNGYNTVKINPEPAAKGEKEL